MSSQPTFVLHHKETGTVPPNLAREVLSLPMWSSSSGERCLWSLRSAEAACLTMQLCFLCHARFRHWLIT